MFCSKCGAQINDNAEICTNCGCSVSNSRKKSGKKEMSTGLRIFCLIAGLILAFITIGISLGPLL